MVTVIIAKRGRLKSAKESGAESGIQESSGTNFQLCSSSGVTGTALPSLSNSE